MPSIKNVLLAAASASAVAAKVGEVNVYYGQHGTDDLGSVCETGVDYVTLAFVNISPENGGPSGYAGDNFGAHCWATTFNGSSLYTTCPSITDNWSKCTDNGVKVLLSVGGVYDSGSNYSISSDAAAVEFADFLWGAFGPNDGTGTYPRPFGDFAVDGFDLDIEEKFSDTEQAAWGTLVSTLRGHFAGGDYLVTAAPQCPFSDANFQMGGILSAAAFDKIWVQFYNNPVCDGLGSGFNFDQWVTYLDSTPNANAPIFIGLPASSTAAGSGYLDPDAFEALIVAYRDKAAFGGIMLWDENLGLNNVFATADGTTNYVQLAIDLVNPTAATSSSSSIASSTSSAATSSSATSTVASSTASATSMTSMMSMTSSAMTSSAMTMPSSTMMSSTNGTGLVTSTVQTTITSTILSCAPTVTDCPYGKVTTEIIDLYTTVCPATETGKPAPTGPIVVTLYSTSYETVTSCAPTVTDCPARVTSHAVPTATTTIYVGGATSLTYGNGHFANATIVTKVASTGALPTGAPVPSSPSAVTAGAAKVSSSMGVAALLVAAVMLML